MLRKLPWAALGLISAFAVINVTFTGCGSEDEGIEDPLPDGGDTETGVDAATDGFITTVDGSRADAADCKLVAAQCTSSLECCSNNCNTTTKQCEASITVCAAAGAACTTGPECCTFSCLGGKCSSKQCVADNLACGADGECCGGKCSPDGTGGGKCAPLNSGGGSTGGNPCTTNANCASQFCNNGVCQASSFCGQNGEECADNNDCCGGLCTKQAGRTLGTCGAVQAGGAGGCEPAGTLCTGSVPPGACTSECCSRSCAPYPPSGKTVCQPASGCRVLGDLCRANSDCCGWSGSPQPLIGEFECVKASASQEFGVCGKGNSCKEPGSICGKALEADGTATVTTCSTANNCCELNLPGPNCNNTPENCCRRDALGVPRCIINKNLDCTNGMKPPAGTVCATSADCCGNPCVNNKCLGTCVAKAGVCTSNADCCSPSPCVIPAGSLQGICGGTPLPDGGVAPPSDGGTTPPPDAGTPGNCALYGQMCTQSSQCCSGVPCTGGTCRFP
jgi:hypothetical protein